MYFNHLLIQISPKVLNYILRWQVGKNTANTVKARVRHLLDFNGGTVTLMHKSMDDFLRGGPKSILSLEPATGHKLLAVAASSYIFPKPSWEKMTK
jgi:hypothetical protein